MDFITNQLLMPLGGMFVAIFAGWFLSTKIVVEELSEGQEKVFNIWKFLLNLFHLYWWRPYLSIN